jgi:dTDP-4-amino-4,6-dideoxygalactose transaminase
MPVPLLDLKAQYGGIRDEVVAKIMGVVDSQVFILGEEVTRLEQEVAALSRVKHAVACASGTDALLLAYRALDAGPGTEVVTTPFTFFATAGAIHNAGAKPVFVDIEPKTFNIDPAAVKAAVTSRTRAIVPVDLFGQMAALECIRDMVPNVPIVEDAAQSIGARRTVNGRDVMAGELPTIGTFSFYPSKNLGGYGDGGMMVTQDDAIADRLRRLRTHGGLKTYYHDEVGFNSRLDSLQAAILRAKLPHLERWSERRRENAAYYNAAFADVPEVVTPFVDPNNVSIFNQYTLRVQQRDALQEHLNRRKIGNYVYYPLALHLQPCFSYLGYKEGSCPEAERATKEVLSLPVYPELTRTQLDEVIQAVREFYKR